MDETRLKQLRRRIDSIDGSIVDLLRERVSVAVEIGKAKGGAPVYDPEREKAVVSGIQKMAPEIDPQDLARVYLEIMSMCRNVQVSEKEEKIV
jgi:chorismate mutase/prephenate dehydratase